MSDRGAEHQRARLAYEASLRALDQQHKVLEDLRSRTGLLLAAASLSASFLGARAFDGHASVALSAIALVALAVTLVLGIVVLMPRPELVFSTEGTLLYADLYDVDDPAEQHRYLAHWLDEFWEGNELPIQQMTRRFEIAAGALVVQVLAWILAVTATLS
ncbi:MAG TPA: hypothetical protein VFU94_09215 [Conexibacter sp.]|nr:hypothetical protein [Conexibacter sp.]